MADAFDVNGTRTVRSHDFTNEARPNNKVITAKWAGGYLHLLIGWTLLDFFTQAANVYFLVICILQSIAAISVTDGIPVTLLPLAFVYCVSLIREAFEEWVRRSEQYDMNVRQKANVLRPRHSGAPSFTEVSWQDIRAGDIVRVDAGKFFPCDLVLLGVVHEPSDEEEGEQSASARKAKMTSCHVDTASLDGETNLKKFAAASGVLAEVVQDADAFANLSLSVTCGPGMAELDKFEGSLTVDGGAVPAAGRTTVQLKASTKGNVPVLLRECKLRNCKHIYGMAVYTGHDTFIKQQSKEVSLKPVFLSQQINRLVMCMFFIQLFVCFIGAVLHRASVVAVQDTHWYLDLGVVDPVESVLTFFVLIQVTSGLIPISLYVSMEVSRVAQKIFMERDDDMYHVINSAEVENIRPKVRAVQLNDQLGQVTHIFSDKTGTLTENSFEFRKLSVGGHLYGAGTTEIAVISARGQARTAADREKVEEKQHLLEKGRINAQRPGKVPHVNFVEEDSCRQPLLSVLSGQAKAGPLPGCEMDPAEAASRHVEQVQGMLLNFLCCSTVDIEPQAARAEGEAGTGAASRPGADGYKLAGDSSDEVCFCYAAWYLGARLVRRTFVEGLPAYEIEMADYGKGAQTAGGDGPSSFGCGTKRLLLARLQLNEFSSARGMMSVAIMDPEKSDSDPTKVTVFVKGSDKKVWPCLFSLNEQEQRHALEAAEEAGDAAGAAEARWRLDLMEEQRAVRGATKHHANDFSEDGLRTLAFARRFMSLRAFSKWASAMKEARVESKKAFDEWLATHPGDERGASAQKAALLGEALAQLEHGLELQGVVGYEDSLQTGVPDAISRLGDAGIRVWMLTGDKEGTAINIGYGVQMLTNETAMLQLSYQGRYDSLFNTGREFVDRDGRPRLLAERSLLNSLAKAAGIRAAEALQFVHASKSKRSRVLQRLTRAALAGTSRRRLQLEGAAGETSGISAIIESLPPLPGSRRVGGQEVMEPLQAAAQIVSADPLAFDRLKAEGERHTDKQLRAHKKANKRAGRTLDSNGSMHASVVGHDRPVNDIIALWAEQLDMLADAAHAVERCEASPEDKSKVRKLLVQRLLLVDLTLYLAKHARGSSRPLGLVLDERAMTFLLDWPGYEVIDSSEGRKKWPGGRFDPKLMPMRARRDALLSLSERCAAVVAARCQPSQKRTVLELVKYEVPGSCCLAIGDGANDVEMILAGNVGVGIKGVEGNSAANAADYSIGQFRFLLPLLLKHGRWNYMRMSLLILFMFYKNMLFTAVQFGYGVYSLWSGQKVYLEVLTQSFNLIFTGLPVVVVATLDADVDYDSAQRFPNLYAIGRERRAFSMGIAMMWLLNGVWEAVLLLLIMPAASWDGLPDGYSMSVYELGTATLCIVVAIINLRLAMEVHQHEWMLAITTILSSLAFPAIAFLLDISDSEGSQGSMMKIFGSASFWLTLPIVIVVIMLPVALVHIVRILFFPAYRHIVREADLLLRNDRQDHKFNPMVEHPDTAAARRQGQTVTHFNRRLERATSGFDRHSALSKVLARTGQTNKDSTKDMSWEELEARLVLQPIEQAVHRKMAKEERTRHPYPFLFHTGLAVRKRIHNLVQQDRLSAEAVGLFGRYPDEDVIMNYAGDDEADIDTGAGNGNEQEAEKELEGREAEAAPAAAAAAAGSGAAAGGGSDDGRAVSFAGGLDESVQSTSGVVLNQGGQPSFPPLSISVSRQQAEEPSAVASRTNSAMSPMAAATRAQMLLAEAARLTAEARRLQESQRQVFQGRHARAELTYDERSLGKEADSVNQAAYTWLARLTSRSSQAPPDEAERSLLPDAAAAAVMPAAGSGTVLASRSTSHSTSPGPAQAAAEAAEAAASTTVAGGVNAAAVADEASADE